MALVLTRKIGERLRIGDDIVVTLVETGRSKCRLLIEAPREVSIWRGEIADAIAAEAKRDEVRPAG